MRTFYRSAALLITDQVIQLQHRPGRTIPLGELQHVYVVRVGRHPTAREVAGHLWLAALAIVVSIIATATDSLSGSRGPWIISSVAFVAGCASLLAKPTRRRPVHELWAVVEGAHECILRCSDPVVFGQVGRALVRAREARE